MTKEGKDAKKQKNNKQSNKIEKNGDAIMEKNEKEVLENTEEAKEVSTEKNCTCAENPCTCGENPSKDEPKMVIVNPAKDLKEEKFSDKLAEGIEGAAKVTAKAVVTGYNKAEAFVKSEEFKQGVKKTKNTTKAVAVGLFKGLKKLGEEVAASVKEAKNREEPVVDPNQDKTKDI